MAKVVWNNLYVFSKVFYDVLSTQAYGTSKRYISTIHVSTWPQTVQYHDEHGKSKTKSDLHTHQNEIITLGYCTP